MAEPTARIDSARIEPAYSGRDSQSSANKRDPRNSNRRRPASTGQTIPLPEIEVSADTQNEYVDQPGQPAPPDDHEADEKHELDTMA